MESGVSLRFRAAISVFQSFQLIPEGLIPDVAHSTTLSFPEGEDLSLLVGTLWEGPCQGRGIWALRWVQELGHPHTQPLSAPCLVNTFLMSGLGYCSCSPVTQWHLIGTPTGTQALTGEMLCAKFGTWLCAFQNPWLSGFGKGYSGCKRN